MSVKIKITLSFLFLFYIPLICGSERTKCCKSGQFIIQKNSKYFCETILNERLQDNFEDVNFLERNISGSCVEADSQNKIALFSVTYDTDNIRKIEDTDKQYFPKCCHLGSLYNETLHSCSKKNIINNLSSLIKDDSFITVGLPNCEIISDSIFDSINEIEVIDNSLIVRKTGKRFSNNKYCVDSTLTGRIILRVCEKNLKICERIRCIHKCCPDGQSYVNGSNCHNTYVYGVDLHSTDRIENPDAPFAIIHGIQKPIYKLQEDKYNFSLDSRGVFASYMNKSGSFEYSKVSEKSYCIDHAYKKGIVDGYAMFAQQTKQKLELKFAVTRWVKIVSCIFLLLTITVYVILPKMRNLFGKILLSYSVATFLFFFFLSVAQFYFDEFDNNMCRIIGFCSVLASICSFTWLHIMCIDIWISFGTPRTITCSLHRNEWKRLLQYSLYGWGFPLVWILLIVFFNVTTVLPESIRPIVGNKKCYIENYDSDSGNYAYFLFITLPLLIQQVVNTVLFVKTILYCLRIKAEIQRMNDSKKQSELNASKERLALIMKLAVIMGVSFLFETISSLYNFQNTTVTTYIEVIWDTINCLQGVFIFIIFICKKRVLDSLRHKIPVLKTRKTSMSSSATTQVSLQNIGHTKRDKTSH